MVNKPRPRVPFPMEFEGISESDLAFNNERRRNLFAVVILRMAGERNSITLYSGGLRDGCPNPTVYFGVLPRAIVEWHRLL